MARGLFYVHFTGNVTRVASIFREIREPQCVLHRLDQPPRRGGLRGRGMVRAQRGHGNFDSVLLGASAVTPHRRLRTVLRCRDRRRPRFARFQLAVDQPSASALGATAGLGRLDLDGVSARHSCLHLRHQQQTPAQG
jgi:hypothetical protein